MSRILSFVAVALASLITGCASLPSLEGRTATPGTRWLLRSGVDILSILPIEWLL
jgi:hypothetical protein